MALKKEAYAESFIKIGQKLKKRHTNKDMGLFARIPFKENNENDIAAHPICFHFYYCPQSSLFADTRPRCLGRCTFDDGKCFESNIQSGQSMILLFGK